MKIIPRARKSNCSGRGRSWAIYRPLIKSLMTCGKRSSTLILSALARSNHMNRHICAYTAFAVHVKALSLAYAAITPGWHAAGYMFRRMIFSASFFLALASLDTASATGALTMIQKTGFCAGGNGRDTIHARNAELVPYRKKRFDCPQNTLYVISSYIERGQFFSCASVDGGQLVSRKNSNRHKMQQIMPRFRRASSSLGGNETKKACSANVAKSLTDFPDVALN